MFTFHASSNKVNLMKLWQSIWGSKDAKQSQLPRIFQYRYKIPMFALKVVLLCILLLCIVPFDIMHPERDFVISIGIFSVVALGSLALGLWTAKFQVQAVKMGIQNQIYWKDTKPNRRARYLLFSVASAMVAIILLIMWGTSVDDVLSGLIFLVMLLSYHIGKDIFIIRWSLRCFRA